MKIIVLFIALLVLWAPIGCEEEPDGCQPETTRCTTDADGHELAQVCNADKSWQTALNCTDYEWICCEVDGGVACLPEEECAQ